MFADEADSFRQEHIRRLRRFTDYARRLISVPPSEIKARGCIFFLKDMKRLLQVATFALIAVLTAQPALAGLTCGMTPLVSVPCAPKCDMAMSHMGVNCAMHHHETGAGCQQDCCRHGWPPALVQAASKTRPKTSGTPFMLAVPVPASAPAATFAAAPPEDIVAAAPDRHVLLQVFRI
jgi:hypothetical protein